MDWTQTTPTGWTLNGSYLDCTINLRPDGHYYLSSNVFKVNLIPLRAISIESAKKEALHVLEARLDVMQTDLKFAGNLI